MAELNSFIVTELADTGTKWVMHIDIQIARVTAPPSQNVFTVAFYVDLVVLFDRTLLKHQTRPLTKFISPGSPFYATDYSTRLIMSIWQLRRV
jgi:hypothetical protein